MVKKGYIAQLLGLVILAGTVGYLLGRLLTLEFSIQDTAVTLESEVRDSVPVVHIEKILNGELIGEIQGDVRFVLGDDIIVPDENGEVRAPADPLLTDIITVEVPEWAHFVASSKGTKYYPVDSSQGERIVPANRVYFETQEEAEEAGYEA